MLSGLQRCGLAQALISFVTTRGDGEAASLLKKFLHMSLALLPEAPMMLRELVELVAGGAERATTLLRESATETGGDMEVAGEFLKILEYAVDCRLGLPSGILKRFAAKEGGESGITKNFESVLKQTEIPQSSDHTRWKWADVKDIIVESLHIEEKLKEA